MVLIFASVGSHFGLIWVAVGVATAALLNFLLMTQLSLKLVGMSWSCFLGQFIKPASIYGVSLLTTWFAAIATREATNSDLLVIGSSILVPIVLYGTLIVMAPSLLLGAETRWIFDVLWGTVPLRFRELRLVQQVLRHGEAA